MHKLTNLTRLELMETLDYNPETGIFVWKKRNCQRRKTGDIAGSIRKDGRVTITIKYSAYLAHRLAWLFTYGEWPEFEIDHINLNPNDNRISNLRKASHAENKWNTTVRKNNKLGIKGVSLDKKKNKYQAVFTRNRERIWLGYFNTPEEAAKVYKDAVIRYNGEFARVA